MFQWTKYEEAKKLLKEYNKELAIIINDNNEDQRKRNELEFELHSKYTKKIREFCSIRMELFYQVILIKV